MSTIRPASVQQTPRENGFVLVSPVWTGVDRPVTFGWIVPKKLVGRLTQALMAGVVCRRPEVMTDLNGHTYMTYDCQVTGRYLNADLKRLGF